MSEEDDLEEFNEALRELGYDPDKFAKEFEHQKLHGMSEYPESSNGGCGAVLFALIVIALIVGGIIAAANGVFDFRR